EWEMDILPAEQLGLPTYFIGSIPTEYEGKVNSLSSSGSMENLFNWILRLNPKLNPIDKTNSVVAIQAILRSTAANIDSYGRMNFDPNLFNYRPSSDEWSMVEIFSHLADVDYEVNIPRLESIKNGTLTFIEAAQTDHWAEERSYNKNNPIEEIHRFIKNRKILLELIASFEDNLWISSINHAIFGPTSIKELAKFMTQHDRIHISQIVNTHRNISTKNN
ncbi:MAG TPA: DinB family protein, partial [Anaerolineaceae bacterium]|nr:DinB family protein [Anaerolineaceae bacterium]